jgi:hypothetical protein
MSSNFNKTKFFKDDQKRTRVIGHAGASNQASTFVAPSRVSALQTHNNRLLQRIPRQTVTGTKNGVDVVVPQRTVELKLIEAEDSNILIEPREGETQSELDKRSQHFVEVYRRGGIIPPPLLHKLPDGRMEVVDGKARANAYRMLGVKKYPANENSILDMFNSSRSGTSHALDKLGGAAKSIGNMGKKSLFSAAKDTGRVLGKSSNIRSAKADAIKAKSKFSAIGEKIGNKFPSDAMVKDRQEKVKEATAQKIAEDNRIKESEAKRINAENALNSAKLTSHNVRERMAEVRKAKTLKAEKPTEHVRIGALGIGEAKVYSHKAQTYALSSNGRRESTRIQRRR